MAFVLTTRTPELVVSEGDRVAVLWRARGTNTGAGNGLPATGKHINTRGITIWRVRDGRVREEWSEFSVLALLRQVGLAPGGEPVPVDGGPLAVSYAPPGAPERTDTSHRAVTRAFREIVGEGRVARFQTLNAPGFVSHGDLHTRKIQGEIEVVEGLRALVPDLEVESLQALAQGDTVALQYVISGTNTGAALGLPATGKHFRARGMAIVRVAADGRITDLWSVPDLAQALEQPGALR